MRRIAALAAVYVSCLTAMLASPVTIVVRMPPGEPTPTNLTSLLAQWQQSGQVAETLWFTHGRPEGPQYPAQFESLAILSFPTETAASTWEHGAAHELPTALVVHRADLLADNYPNDFDPKDAVFIVNTYRPIVPAARFQEFVNGYIKPLYAAMFRTHDLAGYRVLLERGKPGEICAFNVLAYRNESAFKALTKLKPRIRDQVAKSVPSYAQFDPIKDSLRIDGHGTAVTYTAVP